MQDLTATLQFPEAGIFSIKIELKTKIPTPKLTGTYNVFWPGEDIFYQMLYEFHKSKGMMLEMA